MGQVAAGTLPASLRVVPPAGVVNEARMYSYVELVELTGMSERWWRGIVASGQIDVFRVGEGRNAPTRIPHTALVAFITRHTIPARATA